MDAIDEELKRWIERAKAGLAHWSRLAAAERRAPGIASAGVGRSSSGSAILWSPPGLPCTEYSTLSKKASIR